MHFLVNQQTCHVSTIIIAMSVCVHVLYSICMCMGGRVILTNVLMCIRANACIVYGWVGRDPYKGASWYFDSAEVHL